MLKNLKLLLKLREEKQGKCDGRITQAEGQLPDEPHPALIPMEVCSPEKWIKASRGEDTGTICLGKSG